MMSSSNVNGDNYAMNNDRIIHVLYIYDTEDSELNPYIRNINEIFQEELNSIQSALDAKVRKTYISSSKFNSSECYNAVQAMDIKPFVDIVIVCVVAHGTSSGNQYPDIIFSDDDRRSFQDVMDLFLEKKPSHLVSIVNACNNKTQGNFEIDNNVKVERCNSVGSSFENSKRAYQKLFAPSDYTLSVAYLSSQSGTATKLDKTGGAAFSSFIDAINYVKTLDNPNWSKVLLKAQSLTICLTDKNDIKIQCPYAELLKVSLDRGEIVTDGEGVYFCNN